MSTKIYYCKNCYTKLYEFNNFAASAFEEICEAYVKFQKPLQVNTEEVSVVMLLRFLEEIRYVVSSEDCYSNIYVKPLGYKRIDNESHMFCMDMKNIMAT